MDTQAILILASAMAQLGLGAAAYRLGTKVAARVDASDKRVDGHEVRIGVLERQAA